MFIYVFCSCKLKKPFQNFRNKCLFVVVAFFCRSTAKCSIGIANWPARSEEGDGIGVCGGGRCYKE